MNDKPLNQELFDDPHGFDFFQAVRLLEKMFPELAAVGRDELPSREVVRFRSRATLEFPASEIHELRESFDENDARKLEMFVSFIGALGVNGVLPTHYTEIIIERARYRDTALWAFLDIFTHRSISLFFRAWEKYRFPIGYDRRINKDEADEFTEFLLDFVGLGTKGLRGKLNLPDESLLPYAGLISQKPHSVAALEQILGDYFAVPIKVEQFFGQWFSLDDESVTKLGAVNSVLGKSVVIGSRIFDNQSKFRVRVGAVDFKRFQAFLPNGTAYPAFCSLIKFYVGDEFDFDLQIILQAKQVPSCILTTRAVRRPRLGWSSWLKTKPFKEDDEQTVLQMDN